MLFSVKNVVFREKCYFSRNMLFFVHMLFLKLRSVPGQQVDGILSARGCLLPQFAARRALVPTPLPALHGGLPPASDRGGRDVRGILNSHD